MSELDNARAGLQRYALMNGPGFIERLERFEAAVRANERSGETTAAVFRIAATDLMEADLGPRPGHTEDYGRGWDDATHRAASYLQGRAQQAET
jgi:hypothetical protein